MAVPPVTSVFGHSWLALAHCLPLIGQGIVVEGLQGVLHGAEEVSLGPAELEPQELLET